MRKTFNDRLQGNRLEWIDDVPETGERSIPVQITILDDRPDLDPKTRGRRMAEILEALARTKGLEKIDPLLWQEETRQDRKRTC